MVDKKQPFPFGGAKPPSSGGIKPPSFGGAKPPSFGAPKNPSPHDAPKGQAGGFAPPGVTLKRDVEPLRPDTGADNYTNLLRSKIEQARKTLEESRARKKGKLEEREFYWMGILKEKEQEAEKIRQEMKAALDKMEMSQAEKESSLRGALEQFEGRLMSVSRELDDEKKKSYRSMQKAREESEASLKVEMALKEIVSSKDYEDKLQNMQNARENLLKDMIRQKDNFNREKSALEEQIGTLSEQISRQREIIARQESNEKIFETQKEKEIEAARRDARSRLEDLVNQVKSREESVRIKENEFRIQELANRQKLDNLSVELKRKESELSALTDGASRLERELNTARQALEEGNSKFAREIDWLKKHFEEERAAWSGRFAEERRLRKETADAHTDIVKERDAVSRQLLAARAQESDLTERLAEKEKELADMKISFEREKDEVRNIYESGLRDISSARDGLVRELESSSDAVRRFADEKNKLEEDLRAARERLSEKESEVNALAQKIKERAAQIQSIEQSSAEALRSFEQEKQDLLARIRQLNSEKDVLLRDKSGHADRMRQVTSEISRKEQVLRALQTESHDRAEEYAREKGLLEQRIKNFEDEKGAMERKIAEYASDSGALKDKLRAEDEKAVKASEQLNEARGLIESLNRRLAESEKERALFISGEKRLLEKLTEYERAIEQLNKDIVSLKEEQAKGRAFKDAELEKARAEIAGLNDRLDGILEEKNKLSEKYKAISEELFDMTKQRDTLFDEKNALAEDLSSARGRIETLLGEASEKSGELAASGAELALLNGKLKSLSAERQAETVDLKNKILEQHKKMEELFSRINEYNIEIESLKAEPRESVEEYKRQLIDRENANGQLRSQLEALREEKARSSEGIREDYEVKIAALESKLAETSFEIEKMRERAGRASALDDEIVRKDAQLKEASAELQELRSRIESLEEEKLRSREKYDEDIAAIKEEYAIRRSEVEERAASFEKTKTEIDDIRFQLAALSEENASLLSEKESEAGENKNLRALSAEREKEVADLKERLSMTAGETAAAYDGKIKELSAAADAHREKAAGFEQQLKEAEKEMARLKEESSSENRQADEFSEKLRKLENIIAKQKADISEKMEYIRNKELEFHKILKKKDEDISVLKAELELGLEALEGKSAAPDDGRLAELLKINDELRIKSSEREAMLREEIERKEKEAAEYRNQITHSGSGPSGGLSPASSELEEEIRSRTAEAARLKAEMERARKYHERLENIIKKQDEQISHLQNNTGAADIIKKHDITEEDGGNIKF